MTVNLKITPQNSVDSQFIVDNIRENINLIGLDNFIKAKDIVSSRSDTDVSKTGWVLSAGMSLKDSLRKGFIYPGMFDRNKDTLICVKHSLPALLRYGFKNLNCVVVDPRPIEGTSTHGVVRSQLYEAAPQDTTFFVGATTHPSVTKYLMSRGFKIVGWFNSTDALAKNFRDEVEVAIDGGTNSALRAISLFRHIEDIRTFNLIGFDATVNEPTNKDKVDEVTGAPIHLKAWVDYFGYLNTFRSNKPIAHWTTGELAAQIQDLRTFLMVIQHKENYRINILGTDKGRSLVGQLWDAYVEFEDNLVRDGRSDLLGDPRLLDNIRLFSF